MGLERTLLAGRFTRRNESFLAQQAERDDPHSIFYVAMLRTNSYEAYLAQVGRTLVEIKGKKVNPISGRMEILYARRSGWIVDAG